MAYHFPLHHKIVRFVSAPCSTGKTRSACKYIAANWDIFNHLYVAPSLKLLNETSEQLQKAGVEATVISSDTHPKRVKRAIIEHLKSAPDYGAVLLITWSAYVDLPYFNRRSFWEIIIDEVPQVDRFYRLMLPHNSEFITDRLEIFPTNYPGLSLVKANNIGKLKRLLDAPRDDVHEVFRELFRDVLSPNKCVYVDVESWNRVAEDGDISKQDDENTIFFLSILKPDPLRDAVLLGANVADSMLYHWFAGLGVRFIEEKGIVSGLRQVPADLGERLRISYFVPGKHFSKSLSRTEANGGGILSDKMDELALKEFGEEPFIYIANNGRKSEIVDNAPNMIRAPVVSNGLNTLQHINNIYFSAALNREPKHFRMLSDLGLSSELVHQATSHETCHQGVMRTSLRNPESTEEVHSIVPDEFTAKRLGELLGCHETRQIGDLLPPPKKPLSQTERSRRCQLGRLKEGIFAPRNQRKSSINEECTDSGAFHLTRPNLTCNVTFQKTGYEKQAQEFVVRRYDLHEFIGVLKSAANTPIQNKDELFLWNPATFDPKGGEGYRRQEYFVQSSLLVLDFDDGTLSPEEFEDIFWHKAKRGERHSFVIHNSFSRSKEHPNKFRVILFYQRPPQSIEDHQATYDYISERLRESGHTLESSELDPNCRSGNQPFWMPSTNRAHPAYAFFRTHGTKTRELERYAIDPVLIPRVVRYAESPAIHPSFEPASRKRSLEKAAVIEAELVTMTSGRNHLFYLFGDSLARAGLSMDEIEARLLVCAGPETNMQKKVSGVLKSLKGYGLIEWC